MTLQAHGATGIFGLGRKFRIADDDNSGQISHSEFEKVVAEHALHFTKDQIAALFSFFDKDKSGSISYDEFIVGVRGELNDLRKQLVLQAFEVRPRPQSLLSFHLSFLVVSPSFPFPFVSY